MAELNLLTWNSQFFWQDTSGQLFSALELTFSIDLSLEEGGGSVELVKNGRDMEVNATNVYNYVRKYSQYRYAVNALISKSY